jgi:hypothetical protein
MVDVADDHIVRIDLDGAMGLPRALVGPRALPQWVLEPLDAGDHDVDIAVVIDVDSLRILVTSCGRDTERMLGPLRGFVPVESLTIPRLMRGNLRSG